MLALTSILFELEMLDVLCCERSVNENQRSQFLHSQKKKKKIEKERKANLIHRMFEKNGTLRDLFLTYSLVFWYRG